MLLTYWQIFISHFIPGIVGYGGGPAAIPLVENEVVGRYGWMTVQEFSEVLALANSLPGPINTKMAGYVGYEVGGIIGAIIAIFATVAPSLIILIILLNLLNKFKHSPKVKRITLFVRPVIAILLGYMAWRFFFESYEGIGLLHTVIIALASYLLIERIKINPAFVILGAFLYGGLLL